MDYPILLDTLTVELSILYFKEVPVKISINYVFQSLKLTLILANSADPDEMPPYAAFHLVFIFCKSTGLSVSSMKRVKVLLDWHQSTKCI